MSRAELLIMIVLLFTVVLRFAIILGVVYLLLPRGSRCPHCQVEMALIRNRFLERVLPVVQRRWCLECGWSGVSRRPRDLPRRGRVPSPETRSKPR